MSENAEIERPRYSSAPLPPYSYVPGHTPHPVSDPAGHMYGQPHASAPPLEPAKWRESAAYLYGVDLFNHGFYWEAHEAWESLWHAAGRTGATASWLKALIKLAAAGVKAREGNAVGASRHARRSLELAAEARASVFESADVYCGVRYEELCSAARRVDLQAAKEFKAAQPTLLLPVWLRLAGDAVD
jgi:uncharacterized protein